MESNHKGGASWFIPHQIKFALGFLFAFARPMIQLTAMENFKGQSFTGTKTFDLKGYRVLAMSPYEVFGLDAEMKKTQQAIYVLMKNIDSNEQKVFYCAEVKIQNV